MTDLNKGRTSTSSRRAVIVGTGSFLPANVLSNDDLEKMVETSDEWITVRTGIKNRRIISEGETTASISIEAGKKALEAANVKGEDLELIICATVTPEMVFPSTACFIQQGLGNNTCAAFDISAACSGFAYALSMATSMIENGQINTAMVIGAETLSTITNYEDRASCILFGDGAGAVVLQAQENTDRGILYNKMHADGEGWETISCRAFGSRYPVDKELEDPAYKYMEVRGRETYQTAVRRIVELIDEVYERFDMTHDDLKLVIPHQMNARIIESVVKRLKLPDEKMFINIENYGNTSAASIAIALDEAVRGGHAKEGDLVILVAFGAGLTWAVNLVKL